MQDFIRFVNVSKRYGDQTIISGFNLTVEKGECLTIVGASGSGKTTLLKMVNRLVEPSEGDVFLNGKNIREVDLIQLRRSIGYAIQGSVLFPHLTVAENIAFVPGLSGRKYKADQLQVIVREKMKVVKLDPELKDRYPDELSGGQQQRVGIARALAAGPELLLMDEPFGAVDAITRSGLQAELLRIHREMKLTIIFVTHDIHEAFCLGDRTLILNEGRIEQLDSGQNIMAAPASDYVAELIRKGAVG